MAPFYGGRMGGGGVRGDRKRDCETLTAIFVGPTEMSYLPAQGSFLIDHKAREMNAPDHYADVAVI